MNRITAADYHDIVRVSDPDLSPDSERVAFVHTTPTDDAEEATIYVASIGGGDPRRFTIADGVDSQPRWSPDGDRLAFVSTRGGDDRQQLWILPTDGGEAQRVTQIVGGVSDLEWSPDGSRLCFIQRVTADDRETGRDLAVDPAYESEAPDPRVIDRTIYRAGTEYFDGKRSHVYVLDVEAALERELSGSNGGFEGGGEEGEKKKEGDPVENEALERLTDGDRDYTAPTWGDERTVYYASKLGDDPDDSVTHEIDAHDVESDAVESVTQTTGWATQLAATDDGRVAYAYTPEEKMTMRQTEIRVHDRSSGEQTTPTDPLDRTLDSDTEFEWGPEEESLYFATPDEGSVVVWSVPGDASEEPTRVYGDGVTVEGFSVGEDAIAYVQSEWDHPGDVFVSTRGGHEATRLSRVNDEYLSDRAVREPEEVGYESDGESLQGWVLAPPDFDPNERYPLVVEIHGGPHAQWTTSGTMWHEFQTLAARGYVVFWANPRGSTGYGEDHATAIERDWGGVTLTDVLAGVDAVCDREYVDETNQFVTGGSFGGFMTAWTVGHTDRFRAAVSQRGVYDLTGFYGSTDAFKLVEGDFGATPWEDPELLWEQSPVAHVPAVETPTLVMHSDRDYRTPANTAELFYLGLKKHGVETRLVRYPREGHELSRSGEPGHVVDRLERIVRWFDGYSDHHEAAPALERERDDGLSASDGDGGEHSDSNDE
ncbi:S9 family peptidase [Natronoglomus mannanivorans]|uniref:S9 family peptidase n=1 Tax=Natronoglomus mannanivorans TaxID=2979990 RepID=A0AAP3E1R3_9EURY|nr:S9 family peptidase [Halobacteria archaeon AArc-xg1-1]